LTEGVVIVAARWAYHIYLGLHAYICQPNRYIRPVSHMGFYLDKKVMPEIAKIEQAYPAVSVTEEEAMKYEQSDNPSDVRLAELMRWRMADPSFEPTNDFYLLSSPRDESTIRLAAPIPHAGESAWTQYQRYVSLDRLKVATSTADLV